MTIQRLTDSAVTNVSVLVEKMPLCTAAGAEELDESALHSIFTDSIFHMRAFSFMEK